MSNPNFNVSVTSRIWYFDPLTGEVSHKSYMVRCGFNNHFEIHEVRELSTIHWFDVFGVPDASLSSKNKKDLLQQLQLSAAEAPVVKKFNVNESGLYKFEKEVLYVIGNRVFKTKTASESGIEVILSETLKNKYAWRSSIERLQSDNLSEKKSNTFNVAPLAQKYFDVAPNCSEILFFATLCAGIKPILAVAGLTPYLNFMINLYGKSGSFKSSLIKAITTVSDSAELQGSYTVGKKSNLLAKHKAAVGFVFVLDDYHAQASDYGKRRQADILNVFVRQLETVPNSALVITSAEFLDGIYSTQDRCLQVEVQPVKIELLAQIQKCEQDMPTILGAFVTTLLDHYDEVLRAIPELFQHGFSNIMGNRTSNYAQVLMLVAELYVRYLCPGDIGKSHMRQLKTALEVQLGVQQRHMRQLSLLETDGGDIGIVFKMLHAGILQIRNEQNYQHLPDEVQVQGRQYIFLTVQALKYGLKAYLKTINFNCNSIITHMMDEEILCCDRSGDATKKITSTGRRVLVISIPMLVNFCLLNLAADEEIMRLINENHK